MCILSDRLEYAVNYTSNLDARHSSMLCAFIEKEYGPFIDQKALLEIAHYFIP